MNARRADDDEDDDITQRSQSSSSRFVTRWDVALLSYLYKILFRLGIQTHGWRYLKKIKKLISSWDIIQVRGEISYP